MVLNFVFHVKEPLLQPPKFLGLLERLVIESGDDELQARAIGIIARLHRVEGENSKHSTISLHPDDTEIPRWRLERSENTNQAQHTGSHFEITEEY
jgi:hypothetical protein